MIMMFPRVHRISIDLDTKNQFKLLKAYFNMKRFSDNVEVKETGKGFHVKGYFENRTPEQNIHIRRMLGDCEGRLELDERRLQVGLGEFIETLFIWKKIRGKVTMEQDYNIMSEQFWGFKL
jgi:hypothetical protein